MVIMYSVFLVVTVITLLKGKVSTKNITKNIWDSLKSKNCPGKIKK